MSERDKDRLFWLFVVVIIVAGLVLAGPDLIHPDPKPDPAAGAFDPDPSLYLSQPGTSAGNSSGSSFDPYARLRIVEDPMERRIRELEENMRMQARELERYRRNTSYQDSFLNYRVEVPDPPKPSIPHVDPPTLSVPRFDRP